MAREYQPQRFPIIYPASAGFVKDNLPSGAVGATATLTLTFNTRPHMLVGLRLENIYAVPERLQNIDGIAYLDKLDEQQDMTTALAQQNIIIRPTLQTLVTGRRGVHWHPFEVPYPFRGGNNIVITVSRLTAYPVEIEAVTCKLAVVGWAYIEGDQPPPGPPSTGFPTGA